MKSSTIQPVIWRRPDGSIVSCVEKIKVLHENLAELRQIAQDAFEDGLLLEVDETQLREEFLRLMADLENPYQNPAGKTPRDTPHELQTPSRRPEKTGVF